MTLAWNTRAVAKRVFALVASAFALFLTGTVEAQTRLHGVSGAPLDAFGQACGLTGDLNGDGHADFFVGAPEYDNQGKLDAGAVFLYSGRDRNSLGTILGGGSGDRLGSSCDASGDLDADGHKDVCVGVPLDDVPGIGVDAGSVRVLSGSSRAVLLNLSGEAAGDAFGTFVTFVGDLNSDGHADLLISAPGADTASGQDSGVIVIHSGKDGNVLLRVSGSSGSRFGLVCAAVGDVNGDGSPDFAGTQRVSLPLGGLSVVVRVLSGADGRELFRRAFPSGPLALAGGADFNRDAFSDILVGMQHFRDKAGQVRILSGFDGSTLFSIDGKLSGDRFGAAVCVASDLDGDGYGDFCVTAPRSSSPLASRSGSISAFSGRTGTMLFSIGGGGTGARIGTALGSGEDVNGDGIPDVIASAPDSGRAIVVSFVPIGVTPFGSGSGACQGTISLMAAGVPILGDEGFALHMANTRTAPVLLIGDTPVPQGVSLYGALFHLDPFPAAPALGLISQIPLPAPDERGGVVAPFPLPDDMTLLGQTFVFQALDFQETPACGSRLATSRALLVTIQP